MLTTVQGACARAVSYTHLHEILTSALGTIAASARIVAEIAAVENARTHAKTLRNVFFQIFIKPPSLSDQ